MKKYVLILACALLTNQSMNAQTENPSHNVIQLALLLDVSGSMDGLIDQAKSELWTIVNEVAKAKKRGHHTRLEIALYEYGRSSNPEANGYIVKLLDYTSDLDTISKALFSLTTNGGEEYCGWVIRDALQELQWRNNDSVYRVIFIAGNEPFNQGGIDYRNSLEQSGKKGVIINTIHCGDSMEGVNGHWMDGAIKGKGAYFFINQNSKQYDIPTPYDSMIGVYNDSLNTTYWSFGDAGFLYKSNQMEQDGNASKMGASIKAKRAVSKSSAIYNNSNWDAVDAMKTDSNWIEKTKEEDLPAELKGKKPEERKFALDSAAKKRQFFSEQIARLNVLRETYIREHKPVATERSLGMALVEAIHRQASRKGFVFE